MGWWVRIGTGNRFFRRWKYVQEANNLNIWGPKRTAHIFTSKGVAAAFAAYKRGQLEAVK